MGGSSTGPHCRDCDLDMRLLASRLLVVGSLSLFIAAIASPSSKSSSNVKRITSPVYTVNQLPSLYQTLTPLADQNGDGIHEFEGITKSGTVETLISSYNDNKLTYSKK